MKKNKFKKEKRKFELFVEIVSVVVFGLVLYISLHAFYAIQISTK